jgi:uncharacterized membrane protein YphA (DoxX/SURF4 family)
MKTMTIVSWVLAVILGVFFVAMAGPMKQMGGEEVVANFAKWGYPDFFRYVVGVVEIAAGVMTIYPKTRTLGASVIALVMVGATATHLMNSEPFTFPLVLLAVAAGPIFVNRKA